MITSLKTGLGAPRAPFSNKKSSYWPIISKGKRYLYHKVTTTTIESISKLKGKYRYFSSPVTSEPALSPAVPGGRAPGLRPPPLQSKTLNPQGQISGATDTARPLRNGRVVSSYYSRWMEKLFQSNPLCAVDG